MIPAFLSFYIKYQMLLPRNGGGFYVVAQTLGRVKRWDPLTRVSDRLSLWEKLSFFRADVLVGLLLVPLALMVLTRYLPRRWRTLFVAVLSVSISIALYIQLRSFEVVGQFLSSDMLWAAISWGLHDPSVISGYLNFQGFLVLLAAAIGMAGVWSWWAKRKKGIARHPRAERRWRISTSVAVSCVLAITALAWVPRLPSTPFHESVLLRALRAFANKTELDTKEFGNLQAFELASRYRELTHGPAPEKDLRYWGKAKGYNVLFLILETAPARVLPAEGDLSDFPNLRRLRETSFIALSHHSSYPSTHQAVFSLFSSWYPSSLMNSFQAQHPDLVVPGIMRILSNLGYDTALYRPYDFTGEPDAEMFRSLGFQRQLYPKPHRGSKPLLASDPDLDAKEKVALDMAALSLLKRDLEQVVTEGRRFAYVLTPAVSHAPWPDLKRNGEEKDILKRGRTVLAFQDAWLGELIELLERHHQLEQTVIVVVGDHGIRTREEDPSLAGGMIDDYSFHVPLVIYAPKVLDHMQKVPWVTSHIDVAPTVLELLGVERERNFEQGTPIWNANLAKRTTYFFGQHYLGADGYYSNGQFFMWSHVTDSVYVNTRLNFNTSDLVLGNSPTYLEVSGSIRRMAGLQEVWATRFSQARSLRNSIYSRKGQ